MPSISYILDKPHNENVSLSYVGGLLYPGTTDNSLLMSYYIDWCIKFDDSELIHTTTDFVNYLLRKIDELTERVINLENNAPAPSIPVTGISISDVPLNMNVGDTHKLTVLIAPANASNTNVTWSSSNTSIATVSNTGSITAKSAGTVTITATSVSNPSVKDTCTIKVQAQSVTNVSISNTIQSLFIGDTHQLNVSVYPENAPNKNIIWMSSNTSIATVSNTGLVTAKASGSVTITATSQSNPLVSDTCDIMVKEVSVTSVSISNTIASLFVGNTRQLDVTVYPNNATNKNIIWSSSNNSIATVSDTGLVTAKAEGNVTITATSQSNPLVNDTTTISISEPSIEPIWVSKINLDVPSTITYGDTARAIATVYPASASNKTVVFSSSNTSVATINESSGAITALKAGTFTITVSATDGSGVTTTSSTITVERATQTINASDKTITFGTSGNSLKATTSGNGTISYKVASGSSVSVNSSTGALTINSAGNTTITISASETGQYNKATKNVTVIVNKASQTLSASANPSIIEIGGTTTATVSGNKTPVTWSSSNTAIANVNSTTGLITGISEGTTTIIATASANANYKEGKDDVTIKVRKPAQPEETYYYYYGIQDGTLTSPSSPITSSNYKTLAEPSNTLKDSMDITTERGYAYVLVPNTVTEVKLFDKTLAAYSTMKFDVVDTSIPGHLVYKSQKVFSSGALARLDFSY